MRTPGGTSLGRTAAGGANVSAAFLSRHGMISNHVHSAAAAVGSSAARSLSGASRSMSNLSARTSFAYGSRGYGVSPYGGYGSGYGSARYAYGGLPAYGYSRYGYGYGSSLLGGAAVLAARSGYGAVSLARYAFPYYGRAYGAYGYGGYGAYGGYYRPYGYGYGYYAPWGIVARSVIAGLRLGRAVLFPWSGYGYGPYYGGYAGYGYCNYGYPSYGYGYSSTAYYQPTTIYASTTSTPVVVEQPATPQASPEAATDFAAQGEAEFRAGNYAEAVRSWRHALVDDPQNGGLLLLLSQALLAVGDYDEAAGALQAALAALPADKWGVVVTDRANLYRSEQDYIGHLRALEDAAEKQASPAMQFLLGHQYGFIDYPKEAVRELDKGLRLAPQDDSARKLRERFAAKLPAGSVPAAPPATGEFLPQVPLPAQPQGAAKAAPQQ